MPRHYSIDQGRAYIHKTCGTTTVVSGRDFAELCNPFAPCLGTICAKCGPDSTKKFKWADTRESVSRFRRRVRRASPLLTVWSWMIAPVIGAVIGTMVGLALKGQNIAPIVVATMGATVGGATMLLFIAPFITGIVVGQRFYNQR